MIDMYIKRSISKTGRIETIQPKCSYGKMVLAYIPHQGMESRTKSIITSFFGGMCLKEEAFTLESIYEGLKELDELFLSAELKCNSFAIIWFGEKGSSIASTTGGEFSIVSFYKDFNGNAKFDLLRRESIGASAYHSCFESDGIKDLIENRLNKSGSTVADGGSFGLGTGTALPLIDMVPPEVHISILNNLFTSAIGGIDSLNNIVSSNDFKRSSIYSDIDINFNGININSDLFFII